MFGDYPLHMSQDALKFDYPVQPLAELDKPQECIRVRGYLHNVRATGKSSFFILRQGIHMLQCVSFGNKELVKYAATLSRESYLEIHGDLVKAEQEVKSCTIKDFELQVKRVYCISKAISQLPI